MAQRRQENRVISRDLRNKQRDRARLDRVKVTEGDKVTDQQRLEAISNPQRLVQPDIKKFFKQV